MRVRTQLYILAGLLLLFAAVDFTSRIHVGRDESLRVFEAPRVRPAVPVETVEALRARMRQWLPAIGGFADDVGPGQAADLSLQGVFAARGKAAAVLMVAADAQSPDETVIVAEGEVVQGWTVARIERHSVTLERDGRALQLVLFRRTDPGATDSGDRVE